MKRVRVLLALVGLIGAASCGPTIAPFSEQAYDLAVTLKVRTLALMDRATEPYATHADAVADLRLELERAHEFAKGRPRNEDSAAQWALMVAPDGNLAGGFLRRWQERSTLGRVFVTEARALVAEAFDQIIGLESGKLKPGAGGAGR